MVSNATPLSLEGGAEEGSGASAGTAMEEDLQAEATGDDEAWMTKGDGGGGGSFYDGYSDGDGGGGGGGGGGQSGTPIDASDGRVIVVMVGPPGAGKGSVGAKIAEAYDIPLVHPTEVIGTALEAEQLSHYTTEAIKVRNQA